VAIADHNAGPTGPILVKSAWLVNFPMQTAPERVAGDQSSRIVLEHDPAGGIEFMSPWHLLKDYMKELSEDETVIPLLFECTFDSMCTKLSMLFLELIGLL
jgi:hypothetical protein